jgi:hypothetical protein
MQREYIVQHACMILNRTPLETRLFLLSLLASGSPPLQQYSHGRLHTGHGQTASGRYCRASTFSAEADTQALCQMSQGKRQAYMNSTGTLGPKCQHIDMVKLHLWCLVQG